MPQEYAILLSDLFCDEGFLSGAGPERITIDCRDVPETTLYCSEDALNALRMRLAGVPARGLHWIDSGDYHYMTALFLEKIREPFDLLLFDHHPDDQPLAFEAPGMLSCGSWVAYSRRENSFLKNVISVGPSSNDLPVGFFGTAGGSSCDLPHYTPAPLYSGDEPELSRGYTESQRGCSRTDRATLASRVEDCVSVLPLYVSIDLDVLSADEFSTDWDQGTMRFGELLSLLRAASKGRRILGIDVCGGLSRSKGATDSSLSTNLLLRESLRSFLAAF